MLTENKECKEESKMYYFLFFKIDVGLAKEKNVHGNVCCYIDFEFFLVFVAHEIFGWIFLDGVQDG